MSTDFKFKSLQEIISAAPRYELHSDSLLDKDFKESPARELTKHAKPEPVAVCSGPTVLGLVLVTSHNNRILS